jgi:membrane protease YdiL (CAAX protease family)
MASIGVWGVGGVQSWRDKGRPESARSLAGLLGARTRAQLIGTAAGLVRPSVRPAGRTPTATLRRRGQGSGQGAVPDVPRRALPTFSSPGTSLAHHVVGHRLIAGVATLLASRAMPTERVIAARARATSARSDGAGPADATAGWRWRFGPGLGSDDQRAVWVLLVSALALTFNNFASNDSRWFERLLDGLGLDRLAARLEDSMTTSGSADRNDLIFWAVIQVIGYVMPAVLVIRIVLREHLSDHGVRIAGTLRFAAPYAVLYLLAVPALVAVSSTGEFQARYPFLHVEAGDALAPLFVWWVLYGMQFCALEFFFRGFMVHGLAPRFGVMAVFVMAVPYNMLHYGKPTLEALAAIVGGVALGLLALRSRTIWYGAALHIGVALTMDVLSLTRQGVW